MINIVIPNNNNSLIINYFFILNKYKIIIFHDFKDNIEENNHYLFINSLYYPKKNFLIKINKMIKDNIEFCYLSSNDEIFIVKGSNIIFDNNIIDIKKTNNRLILFDKIGNLIDNIMPPHDLNFDYLFLLNHKTYDSKININVAYKAYEKYLNQYVKNNFCFNFIIFINNINQLNIKLPNYEFYRITIFHNIRILEDQEILKSFCKKNNILSCYYINKLTITILSINNLRSIWFEKIVLLKNFNDLNENTIDILNNYHKYFENLVLDKLLSINTTNFVLIPFNNKYNLNYNFYELLESYCVNNLNNCYYYKEFNNKYKFGFKNLENFNEKQLLLVRDYNTITNNIDTKIKTNYNINMLSQLLIKKVSIGSLCKDEKELVKDVDIIITSLNNYEFLSDLVLLFSNFKNQALISKLYIKVLKLGMDNKITIITLNCFQALLTTTMTEETINIILDFLDFIYTKNLIKTIEINETKIKMILLSLFYTICKYIENKTIMEKFVNLTNIFFNLNDLSDIDKILEIEKQRIKTGNCIVNFSIIHYIIFTTTNFSAYYQTTEEFLNKRNEIKNNITNLLEKNLPICGLNEVVFFPVNNFFLSYQGIPSVDIFTLKTKLIRKLCPELNYKIDTTFKNDKINICFHSNFLNRWHSVFKDRHQIIRCLANSDEFNVYFSTWNDLGNEVKFLFGKAKHIKLDGKNLNDIKKLYTDLKLDVLVYCEIGMDPKSFFLAFMKLAKIQINTWGHSDTSGIDTIDYFFSSKLYELPYEESQKHYSEKLILQNSLCTSYVDPLSRYNILKFKNRYDFGFTDEVTIFFCAQSLFKFNPVFDDFIINILNKNENYILIILNNESKQKIISRFNNKNITSKIHIFPGMDHFNYLNLMNISDIILDPYPFGGCNSSFEAFSLGKIVITCASDMINGRFTCGFYKKMDLEYLITYNKDDYVNLALKIANDKAFKLDTETKIKEKSKILFNDEESINEWKNDIKNIYSNL
jgi:hypothetical protein